MKVATAGLDLPAGKTKYNDPIVAALTEKFSPKKVSPYYVEFLGEAYDEAEAIAVASSCLLDLLILDMEQLEGRAERSDDAAEKDLLARCLEALEGETPLCDLSLDEDDAARLRSLGPLSLKPTLVLDDAETPVDEVCERVIAKAGRMFFYTAGPQEVHAWFVEEEADALTCAGAIHSDLARGFIKAELVPFDDLMGTHSFQSARSEGLTTLVDRDVPVPPRTVLEIRFNV